MYKSFQTDAWNELHIYFELFWKYWAILLKKLETFDFFYNYKSSDFEYRPSFCNITLSISTGADVKNSWFIVFPRQPAILQLIAVIPCTCSQSSFKSLVSIWHKALYKYTLWYLFNYWTEFIANAQPSLLLKKFQVFSSIVRFKWFHLLR